MAQSLARYSLCRVYMAVGLLACLSACGAATDETALTRPPAGPGHYVGSQTCAGCHQQAFALWQESHHAKAMQPVETGLAGLNLSESKSESGVMLDLRQANGPSTLHTELIMHEGTYRVRQQTDSGEPVELPVKYTFGYKPLMQLLVETEPGRLQVLDPAIDTVETDFFHVYPTAVDASDPLHWQRPGQNWNFMCADCHSTGVEKNYQKANGQYATQFAEISVGCEACHGPGSNHVEEPTQGTVGLTNQTQQMNVCAQCHSRRSQLAEGFDAGKNYFDHYLPSLLDPDLYHPDGQVLDEVYVYGSFAQSKMHLRGVACSDCHEPHSGQLKFSGNATCTQCHNPQGNVRFPTLAPGNYNSSEHHFHADSSQASQCVTCHMPATTFMTLDARVDHSFRIPRPDLAAQLAVPSVCAGCHGDKDHKWASQAIAARTQDWPPEHFAQTLAAGRRGDAVVEMALAELAQEPAVASIVRGTSLSLLSQYHQYGSGAAVQKGLRSSDVLVRIGAIRGAMRWELAERWQQVKPLLRDELRSVRFEAVVNLLAGYADLTAVQKAEFDPSVDEYRQALMLHEDRAQGLTNLANVDLTQGDMRGAEKLLLEAIKLNPQWIPALVNLADLYRDSGRDAQSGALLDQALTLDAGQPNVLLAKALWLVRQQRRDEALPLLQQAHELSPQVLQFAYVYAIALHSTQRSAQALTLLEQQLSLGRGGEQFENLALSIAQESGDMAAVARLLGTEAKP